MVSSRVGRLSRLTLLCLAITLHSFSQEKEMDSLYSAIDRTVEQLMNQGNIPGLSLVLVKDGVPQIKCYGYADLKSKKQVTPATLFELGSCSKAFTALAVARLVEEGKLSLDQYVSKYIPWFRVTYKDTPVQITVAQLLHHTSGISWSTISKIPRTNERDALEKTVRQLQGEKLSHLPGKKYEYATINYDVLALVIEKITGQPFETYLQQQVIDSLHLGSTTIGYPADSALKATGYKIGFFRPRPYKAPVFRGNNAAGYVISNAMDIAGWLQFQMGLTSSDMYPLAELTHQRDETVPLHGMASYAMGWDVLLDGSGETSHGGENPNFTSFIGFRQKSRLGVAVLTNSNSTFTTFIGNRIMKMLAGEKIEKEYYPGDGNDKIFSIATIILGMYLLGLSVFVGWTIADMATGKRKYKGFTRKDIRKIVLLLIGLIPFSYGIYLLPKAMFGFTWRSLIVWAPVSLASALALLIAAVALTFCTYITVTAFPQKDKLRRIAPKLILLSILSGLANMVLIILVTSSLDSDMELKYLVFYYFLTLIVFLFGRRFVQVCLIGYTMEVIYELRVKIADRVLSTSYQKFENMDRGRVYTSMNDDVNIIGDSANIFIVLISCIFTAAGALLYLAAIALWATILTFSLLLILTTLYFFVSRSTNKYFEDARDTSNVFMRLINGMIDGFKELSLHWNKKREYKEDISASAKEYKEKLTLANIRFVNASFTGESILVILLGVVAFGFPKLFPGIQPNVLMGFVIVLLYLIGPVNTILNSVPSVMHLRISLRRIDMFMKDIPSDISTEENVLHPVPATIESLKVEGVRFRYKNGERSDSFAIGPIDLEIRKGEIIFIVGGNGSGKTTLAKLLTGLYEPDAGRITINGQPLSPSGLGENFSAVFSPMHLFEKLYNIDAGSKEEEIKRYLKLLHLDQKVNVVGNAYSTINLSGGQRKRLALLQCYLEDAPIYLFDEWAADQDPSYRSFFYRNLLFQMKLKGKIIIAITHDDHYFDVADRVYKMDEGKLVPYEFTIPEVFESKLLSRK